MSGAIFYDRGMGAGRIRATRLQQKWCRKIACSMISNRRIRLRPARLQASCDKKVTKFDPRSWRTLMRIPIAMIDAKRKGKKPPMPVPRPKENVSSIWCRFSRRVLPTKASNLCRKSRHANQLSLTESRRPADRWMATVVKYPQMSAVLIAGVKLGGERRHHHQRSCSRRRGARIRTSAGRCLGVGKTAARFPEAIFTLHTCPDA